MFEETSAFAKQREAVQAEQKKNKPPIPDQTKETAQENELSLDKMKEKYKPVIDGREARYDADIEANPAMKNMRLNLEVHNDIVLGYAGELIGAMNLSPEERVAAIIATIEHDSGKLGSSLLDHHEQGVKYANNLLDKMLGQEFEGVKITPEIKQKVLEAIERHMNHPFLVAMHKGERFPEPKDNVDRVVFDADMMANAGFKNVAFRLVNEQFMAQDSSAAKEAGTSPLQASFENVMKGVQSLPDTVLSAPAKELTAKLVEAVNKLMEYFRQNSVFKKIEEQFSDSAGNFNIKTINEKGGLPVIKEIINEQILVAGSKLGIDRKYLKNFII